MGGRISPQCGQGRSPRRAYSTRRVVYTSLSVPTVERGLWLPGWRYRLTVGGSPLIDIHRRLCQPPGEQAQRFHILALPFLEQDVEAQRGLARAGDAAEHHELVFRDAQADVLQVVQPRPADGDKVAHEASLADHFIIITAKNNAFLFENWRDNHYAD